MNDHLSPQTAREALFEIRRHAAEVHVDTDPSDFACEVDRVALEGLDRREPINFELSDSLADRLAEAHAILRGLRQQNIGAFSQGVDLNGKIDEALSLPPDLETVVERRIGPRR